MLSTFCPPTIWTISLEFYRKPCILAADDLLGACYRKAMTPQKLWTLLFLHFRSLENKEFSKNKEGYFTLSGPVLRDTARLSQRYPPIARYGVFGVSTWPIGCDTLSPFSEHFPLGEHAKWRCDTPPQKGYLSDTCAIPYEKRQMGAIPPSAILSRKGIARYEQRILQKQGKEGRTGWKTAHPSHLLRQNFPSEGKLGESENLSKPLKTSQNLSKPLKNL